MWARAEDYPWSSAAAHCGLKKDAVLTKERHWQPQFEGVGNWSAWLAEGEDNQVVETLRKHARKGLPCGSDEFIDRLELSTGRRLRDGRRTKGLRPL